MNTWMRLSSNGDTCGSNWLDKLLGFRSPARFRDHSEASTAELRLDSNDSTLILDMGGQRSAFGIREWTDFIKCRAPVQQLVAIGLHPEMSIRHMV